MAAKVHIYSPERKRRDYGDDREPLNEIVTPFVLKSSKRTSHSPVSFARSIPSRSTLLENALPAQANPVPMYATPSAVIVFGYKSNYKELVLDRFRRMGSIESLKESSGNWMTITYSTPEAARKALAYNCQFVSEGVMIGVKALSQDMSGESVPILPHAEQHGFTGLYLKKLPRRKESAYNKFLRYVLNIDID
jgi:hypothetical protein